MKADGASHEKVVMFADNSTVGTVLLALIGEVFVEYLTVSLGVEMVADNLNEGCYYHGLCGGIGMKAIFTRQSLPYLVLGLATRIEIGIYVGNLIEYILRLVATFNLPLAVVRLQCVGLYDKKRIVIISGYLSGTPSEPVNITVSSPLRHDRLTVTINHVDTVENHNDRPVSLV